jgi:DNA polymerase III epsilon subunit-like protein
MEITTMTLEQARAQMAFNEWNQRQDVVILDTETTGLYDAEICEISVIDREGNVLLDTLVKPKKTIPEEATRIHGITNKMVEHAPSWPEVWEKLYPIIRDKLVLIYNAEFDIRLMAESFEPYMDNPFEETEQIKQVSSIQSACVMRTYADLVGSHKWLKLTEAVGRQIAHRALDDCRATMEVVRKCYDPYFTKETLQKLERWHELEQISKRIRYLSYRMKELAEEQADLLKKQKELQKRLILEIEPETKKETAATVADAPFADDDGIPIDISDDDLPF